jgi:hypothetical protein
MTMRMLTGSVRPTGFGEGQHGQQQKRGIAAGVEMNATTSIVKRLHKALKEIKSVDLSKVRALSDIDKQEAATLAGECSALAAEIKNASLDDE